MKHIGASRSTGRTGKVAKGYRSGRRMREVADYVAQTIDSDGQPPSYGMICLALGIGTRGQVRDIVKRLERDGVLALAGAGRARRIRAAWAP